jgi:hypothetical protein
LALLIKVGEPRLVGTRKIDALSHIRQGICQTRSNESGVTYS